MNVYGMTVDFQGCGYYRMLLPIKGLREDGGHTCNVKPDMTLRDAVTYDPDVVVGQKINTAKSWNDIRRVTGAKLVFEIDDDLWSVDPTNPAFEKISKSDLNGMVDCARISDVVTVSTKPLAEIMRRFNKNVVVLPNCVEELLTQVERSRRPKLTIGWSGGASHYRDMKDSNALEAISDLKGFEIHTIGTNYGKIFGSHVVHHDEFMPMLSLYESIDWDIGIAPLTKSKFNKSKSHIRVLEYAALGIPVVATDWHPYNEFVIHGETGFLASTYKDWKKYLNVLIKDDQLREQMGRAARARAKEYTIQSRWREWEAAYSD